MARIFNSLIPMLILAGCVYLPGNVRAVTKGSLYRSGQMSAESLSRAIDSHGLRTVVNLRGASPDASWYRDERSVCENLGVAHHDLAWSKSRLPTPDSLARLVALFEQSEKPMLVHCQGGTHRSGVAAASYVLLEGLSVEEARHQFGPFFGRAEIGRLLALYEISNVDFATWVHHVYPSQYTEVAD